MLKTQFKIFLIIVVTLAIGLVLGYIWGSGQGLKQGREEVEEKYQAKIEELYPSSPEPEEIFSVSGEIKEVKDKVLTLELTFSPANPFQELRTETRLVKITETTEFVKAVEKSAKEIAKEEEAISKAREESPGVEPSPLEPFKKEQTISLSDLRIGNTVFAETDENIKGKTEFTARRIILLILQQKKEQGNQQE